MDIDAVLNAEIEAERAIRAVLMDLQVATGRRVSWVKVERDLTVTVNTTDAATAATNAGK